MQTNIYTLPELSFVGGKSIEFSFRLKDGDGLPYNASGASVNFSICSYSNKVGSPLLSLTPTIMADEGGVSSILHLMIDGTRTKGYYGKYIYQITIVDISGRIEIPNQGIMNITRNINEGFIS